MSEHTEAVVFMRAVAGALDVWPELGLLYAVPNGGLRNKRVAGQLKAEGVKAGVPDYCLPVARGEFHGLYIELKRPTGGRVSPEQREWILGLAHQGYAVFVARGWEQAWDAVRDYMAQEPPQTTQDGVSGVGCVSTPKKDSRPAQGHTGGNRGGAR